MITVNGIPLTDYIRDNMRAGWKVKTGEKKTKWINRVRGRYIEQVEDEVLENQEEGKHIFNHSFKR